MTDRLVAVQAPPSQLGGVLRRAWERGDAVLPIDPELPEVARQAIVARLRPHQLLVLDDDGTSRRLEAGVVDPLPVARGTALVCVTSGSSGTAKGVELSHTALRAATRASIERLGCPPGSRWVLALPTHHIAGIAVLLRAWALGTEPAVTHPSDERGMVAAGEGGYLALVPRQLRRLVDAGADLRGFAALLVGGAGTPVELLDAARAAGGRVVRSYGMTETCGGCVYDGRPLTGVELALDEGGPRGGSGSGRRRGRIRVRGPMLLSGYRGEPGPVTDAEGWFATDDVGALVDGELVVAGRLDDVIISGGENIPAGAVAAALRTHPQVAEAAVIGVPDRIWGQVVTAVVVAADAADPPPLDVLAAHVRTTLPAGYAPRALVVTDALPRGPLGKLDGDALAALAATRAGG